MAGLLHDIGTLLILEKAATDRIVTPAMFSAPEQNPAFLTAVARHHETVGAAACLAWKLPQGVIDAAQHHHSYIVDGMHYVSGNLVTLADRLADHLGIESDVRPLDEEEKVCTDLNFRRVQIDACVASLEKAVGSPAQAA